MCRGPGRREWLGLAALALPTLPVALDLFVMLLALPHLSAALGASSTRQLWILDIYGFMVAGFLLTMGTLGFIQDPAVRDQLVPQLYAQSLPARRSGVSTTTCSPRCWPAGAASAIYAASPHRSG
jgi:hypothetical protein